MTFIYFLGSSTGPISSSSSTNNDSLSSNVSSSESDCESKPSKQTNLSALMQLPPSSSSSVNGDDYSDSTQIHMQLKKFNISGIERPKRKPFRSTNSINLNDETIKSSHHQQSIAPSKKLINQSYKKNFKASYANHNNSTANNNWFKVDNDLDLINSSGYPVLTNSNANNKKNESLNEPK